MHTVASTYLEKRFIGPLGIIKHKKQVAIINRILAEIEKPVVLDLACGPGRIAKDLHPIHRGYAIDTSAAMLAQARRVLGKEWAIKQMDAFSIAFRPKSIDVVAAFRFIRHLQEDEREKIYVQLRRVLKPHGYFIIDVLNVHTTRLLRLVGKHKRVYDELYGIPKFVQEMKRAGFSVLSMAPVVKHVFLQGAISKLTENTRLQRLGLALVQFLETLPGNQPWEWVAVCRKEGK